MGVIRPARIRGLQQIRRRSKLLSQVGCGGSKSRASLISGSRHFNTRRYLVAPSSSQLLQAQAESLRPPNFVCIEAAFDARICSSPSVAEDEHHDVRAEEVDVSETNSTPSHVNRERGQFVCEGKDYSR